MLVLRVVSDEKGLCGRLKRLFGVVRVERRALGNGYFDAVTVFARRGRTPWRKIYKRLGRRAVCAVMARGIEPPAGCGIMRLGGRDFAERVLFRTFVQAVRAARPTSVGIADADGVLVRAVEELLPFAGQVRVWTTRAGAYAGLTARAVGEYGTAPVVSDDAGVLRGVSAAFLPSGCGLSAPDGCGAVFSSEQGFGVSDAGLVLPEEIAAAVPAGVSPVEFAAAAVACGLAEEGEIGCVRLEMNGGAQSVRGIVREMAGAGICEVNGILM